MKDGGPAFDYLAVSPLAGRNKALSTGDEGLETQQAFARWCFNMANLMLDNERAEAMLAEREKVRQ